VARAILQLKDYGYAYPGEEGFVFENAALEIEAGQCHCLVGPTGSGKTTLVLALKGLLPAGRHKGEISFPADAGRRPGIGVVLQNPETQLLAATVGEEVAFGLENLCVEPALMPAKVRAALEGVGLARPLDFEVEKLSMGQKYRLIMAALLVMEPELLVLDEPSAQLDPEGLGKLLGLVRKLKQAGFSFLLCEHHPERVAEVVDVFWQLDGTGKIRPAGPDTAGCTSRISASVAPGPSVSREWEPG